MPRFLTQNDLSPFVRYAHRQTFSADSQPYTVQAYDHRLFYVVSGSGTAELPGGSVPFSTGSVLYWMSGTPYRLLPREGPLELIALNFDFTRDHAHIVACLPLEPPERFVPERRLEVLQFADFPELNHPAVVPALPEVLPLLRQMADEFAAPDRWTGFSLSHLLCPVLAALCRAMTRAPRNTGGSYREILDYIQRHYAENLTNAALGARFHYHPNYISRLIADRTGMPLHRYLLTIRIRQALSLLQTTALPVGEIARRTGFPNVSYFSHYFKKITGHCPGDFRMNGRP